MTQTSSDYFRRPGPAPLAAPRRRMAAPMFGNASAAQPAQTAQTQPTAMFGGGPVVLPAGTTPNVLASVINGMRQRFTMPTRSVSFAPTKPRAALACPT